MRGGVPWWRRPTQPAAVPWYALSQNALPGGEGVTQPGMRWKLEGEEKG